MLKVIVSALPASFFYFGFCFLHRSDIINIEKIDIINIEKTVTVIHYIVCVCVCVIRNDTTHIIL